jgi:branched-chain amino acid transport system ATP-binding protein
MLSLEKVFINYGPIKAVRDINLTVQQGEIVTLLGPNGAGKSSTLNGIMGLHPISSGQVIFEGQDISNKAPEDIVRLGTTLTPEGRRVFAGLTVEENLRLGAATLRDRREVAKTRDMVFDLFPIMAERRHQEAGTLSGGEQQMLAIGRSLMSKPKLLMLDEPSLGLAPIIVANIFRLIGDLRNRGVTILLVEQNAEMSLRIADRGYVFTTGEIKLVGTSQELRATSDIVSMYMGKRKE